MNISISNCRVQCYDGAANMCGSRNGCSTQICAEESHAIFVHYYGHANKVLRSALGTTLEISKLIKFSPRREATLQKLKGEISPEGARFGF